MSKLEDALAFLQKYLSNGPQEETAVRSVGKGNNFSRRTLQRAAKLLGITRKSGTIFQTWRIWHWMLPGTPGKSQPLEHYIGRNGGGEIGQEMRFGREKQPLCVSAAGIKWMMLPSGRVKPKGPAH